MNGESDIRQMLDVSGIRPQVLQAVRQLAKALEERAVSGASEPLAPLGKAYIICELWQQKFEWALRGRIPDWVGLAAFRSIADFTATVKVLENVAGNPDPPDVKATFKNVRTDKRLQVAEQLWGAYTLYFRGDDGSGRAPEDLHSGKLFLCGDLEKLFLKRLDILPAVLGGQAGNILWLWQSIGAEARGYVPYLSEDLVRLTERFPELKALPFFRLEGKTSAWQQLGELGRETGVPTGPGRYVGAPSGGSVVVAEKGRRLIYQFEGFRDLRQKPGEALPFKKVQFGWREKALLKKPFEAKPGQNTWPRIPLFGVPEIAGDTLNIRLAEPEELQQAFKGKVDFAVVGGLDAVFSDEWIRQDRALQARLQAIVIEQLRAMAAVGIRIGVELSGEPALEYAVLLQRLCAEGTVVVVGINGEDELPKVAKDDLDTDLLGSRLDLKALGPGLMDKKGQDQHFEYITYRRARKLAECLGVRTLYVHTTSLDFILRKQADPGALVHAQMGDMMGKGLVIAALLKREYRDKWLEEVIQMPPAVKPEAMARLAHFAADFEEYERIEGARERLLRSGYWLSPTPEQYSLAVVPVMWPPAPETGKDFKLPEKLNPTGSGDMTFGAFFLLGGV